MCTDAEAGSDSAQAPYTKAQLAGMAGFPTAALAAKIHAERCSTALAYADVRLQPGGLAAAGVY